MDIKEKKCSKCKQIKPLSDFHKSKNGKFGVHHYCKKCNSKFRKSTYKYNIERQTRTKYKVEFEEIIDLYDNQNGRCAICDKHFDISLISKRNGLHIDHCHKTGRVRGLLCSNCNTSIGKFNDNIEVLQNAIQYLMKHE